MEQPRPPGRRTSVEAIARPGVVLGVLVAVAVIWRSLAALALPVPWIVPDEAAYALLGRSFWEHGELAILGGPSQYLSTLYPVFVGLPLRLGGLGAGFDVLRVLQVLVLCSTAVVVYAWARSLVTPWWALAGAALTLLLPGFAYAGTITAEVLFVPLATLAAWATVRALEAPTRANQALLLGALAACLLTRAETDVLAIAVIVGAVVCGRLRDLAPTWLVFGFVVGLWIGLGGNAPVRLTGGYSGDPGYTPLRVIEYVAYHAGDLLLVCAIVPLCAVVLFALTGPRDPALRGSLAVILAILVVAVAQVGVFAAGHAGRLLERELLFALPPLLVGFVAWLGNGAPRPRRRTLGVAAAAFVGLIALPIGTLASTDALTDNPSIVPLIRTDSPHAYGLTALAAVVACALLVWLPHRFVWVLPALVGVAFLVVSVSASHEFAHQSRIAKGRLGPVPQWIDRATAGPVTYLYDGGPDWSLAWLQPVWNRRLRGVLDLTSTSVPGPMPQRQLQLIRDDGVLRLVGGATPDTRLLVAPAGLRLKGRRLASKPPVDGVPGLVLWQLDGKPRVTTWTEGLLPNGDLPPSGTATLTVFDCGRGTFHLVAVGRVQTSLTLARDGVTVATFDLWPHGVWEQTIPTTAGSGPRCTFSLTSTSLVHLDEFGWKRGR